MEKKSARIRATKHCEKNELQIWGHPYMLLLIENTGLPQWK